MNGDLIEFSLQNQSGTLPYGRIIGMRGSIPIGKYDHHVHFLAERFVLTGLLIGKYSIEEGWVTENTYRWLQEHLVNTQSYLGAGETCARLVYTGPYSGPDVILGVRG